MAYATREFDNVGVILHHLFISHLRLGTPLCKTSHRTHAGEGSKPPRPVFTYRRIRHTAPRQKQSAERVYK